jgi:hypothetical protein
MCKFRDLTASEIECRIGQVKDKYLTLLLYKDARVDMNLLDETVGSANWQREHYDVKGNLYCRVGIKLDGEWVWKSDCGVESNADAQKGEASDSFKRACVNWGIGRELYTAPVIKIFADKCGIKDSGRKDKSGYPIYVCYDHFTVDKIEVKDKCITSLTIRNSSTNAVVYSWNANGNSAPNTPQTPTAPSKYQQIKDLLATKTSINMDSVNEWILIKFKKAIKFNDLTDEQFKELYTAIGGAK